MHEQTYVVKINVKSKSTFKLEVAEEMLMSCVCALNKKNVSAVIHNLLRAETTGLVPVEEASH